MHLVFVRVASAGEKLIGEKIGPGRADILQGESEVRLVGRSEDRLRGLRDDARRAARRDERDRAVARPQILVDLPRDAVEREFAEQRMAVEVGRLGRLRFGLDGSGGFEGSAGERYILEESAAVHGSL